MFERMKVLGAVLAAGLVVGACGGGAAGPAAASPQASGAVASTDGKLPTPELTKIRIGISAPSEPVQFAEKLADTIGITRSTASPS